MTEPTYPCEQCGTPRTKAEGGTTFTVCDECWKSHSPYDIHKACNPKALDAGRAQIRRCHAIMQGLVSSIAPEDCDALPVLIDAKKELSGEFCADACTTECDALAEADYKKIEELEAILSETERALDCGRAAEGALLDRVEKVEALNAALEADYQRIIVEIIPHARPASTRADDQLEPPWEVVKRAFGENARLRALNAEILEALRPFESGSWGALKAWVVEGAPTREIGIAAAGNLTRLNCAVDAIIAKAENQ